MKNKNNNLIIVYNIKYYFYNYKKYKKTVKNNLIYQL